jgi:hypothetical protein
MTDLFGKLVVRSVAPKRRAWFFAGFAAIGLVVLYGIFELGRYDAGFRVVDSVRGALSASARIRELESEVEQQRAQLAAADVARRVDREGYKQVERSLGDMQSQIARLNQDLSFYRGLVQPDSTVHVKVQQMQIVPDALAGKYRLKFVLMQTGKPDSNAAGNLNLTINGLERGRPASLDYSQVAQSHRGTLVYAFRYFEDYDEPVQLPAGFEPTRIDTEVHSGRDQGHGFRQAFVWKAQGISMETDAPGAAVPGAGLVAPFSGPADTSPDGGRGKGGSNVQTQTE